MTDPRRASTTPSGASQSTVSRGNLPDFLAVTVAIGLLTGLVESTILEVRRDLLGELVFASLHQVWIGPAAYALLYGSVGGGFWLGSLVLPRLASPALAGAVVVLPSVISLLELLFRQRLHLLAELVVGMGLSFQAWRLLRISLRPLRRLRLLAGVGALIVTLVAAGYLGSEAWSRRRALAELPEADPEAPSFLLIILDTMRAKSMSLYGRERPTTPHLDAWARRGSLFEYAIAPSSWSLPSHVSLLTGRWPHEFEASTSRPFRAPFPTLPEVFMTRGYTTAAFVGNTYYGTRETGLGRGFLWLRAYQASLREWLFSTELGQLLWRLRNSQGRLLVRRHDRREAQVITGEFLKWLDAAPKRPFFAMLNYFDTHDPYHASDSLMRTFWSGNGALDRYEASIRATDDQLDRLFRALDRRGVLDRIVIVVTSDHGEQFREFGLEGHGNSLYLPALRVPLLILYPRKVPQGYREFRTVSLRNVPATLLRLAGIGQEASIPGHSVLDSIAVDTATVLSELAPSPRTKPSGRHANGEIRSVVLGGFQYISNPAAPDELFDIHDEPGSAGNLLRTGGIKPALVARMRAIIQQLDQAYPRRMHAR